MKAGLIGMALVLTLVAAPALAAEKDEFRFERDEEISAIRPGRPVTVRLKRDAQGKYTWDITGEDVAEVIKADKELRKYIKTGEGK